MITHIKDHKNLYAIIIKNEFNEEGIHFVTPDDLSQQMAYMNHKKDKVIPPHYHNPVERQVIYTQEVLFIKKGILRVDIYNNENEYYESHLLRKGDTILLISGGHGFKVIEDLEMIEVKQGPFSGELDKTRFVGINDGDVKVCD
ncbi:hypothetical protein ACFSCX_09410 [Bacillus salitolerans]|uniref:Cupin domain-containing protein n=1 Tax=Bacillus salitolerans TaxID=1437434 RepID=A0ABW4LNP2_9BACI